MVNRYIKHIVLLAACLAVLAVGAFGQKADSSAVADDTTLQQATVDSSSLLSTGGDTVTKTALDKFALKDDSTAPGERKIPQAKMKEQTSSDDFWYANKPMPGDEPVVKNNGLAFALQLVFWALAAVIVIGIIVVCIRFFANKPKVINEVQPAADEGAGENIFDMDFEARINKATAAGDYRLATRLLFLRLLRTLAEKNIIKYGIEKTNFDYQFELGGSRYFKDFSVVSRNYEYVWYGNFSIQQSQFITIKQRLDELNRQINN